MSRIQFPPLTYIGWSSFLSLCGIKMSFVNFFLTKYGIDSSQLMHYLRKRSIDLLFLFSTISSFFPCFFFINAIALILSKSCLTYQFFELRSLLIYCIIGSYNKYLIYIHIYLLLDPK